MTVIDNMPVAALANWFGRDGEVIDRVAAELDGCKWIGVPFGGGMGALSRLRCNQGVAADLHHHILNVAAVAADPALRDDFMDRLSLTPCSHAVYVAAQERCREREKEQAAYVATAVDLFGNAEQRPGVFASPKEPDVAWAVDYFIVSWMGQGGRSGTKTEFTADSFSVRWKATGGSSSSRWRSAIASLPAIGDVLKRWTFVCMDAFELLDQAFAVEQAAVRKGQELRNGLYPDPPFPTVGEPYAHAFDVAGQRRLANSVSRFKKTRVVMRFHENPLVREL